MAMSLKAVLDGSSGQANLGVILMGARQAIMDDLVKKRTKGDIVALETRLNNIFYSKEGKTAVGEDYIRRTSNATEKTITEVFENFDFESNKTGNYSAKESISPTTLSRSLYQARFAITSIMEQISNLNPGTSIDNLSTLLNQAQQLIDKGAEILNTTETVLQFGTERIIGSDFKEALTIVNQLNAFSQMLSDPGYVSPQEAGIIFEEALALTNFVEDSSEATIDEIIREMSKKSQFGAETVQRGGSGLISYTMDINSVDQKEASGDKSFKINKGGMTATYQYNPSAARQGKMDVQLNYNGVPSSDYRVSAKRWTRGYGDLGETSIDAGITRASGQTVAEAYKMAVLTPSRDLFNSEVPSYSAAEIAHNFAQLALKSDIAMGLNQVTSSSGAGYANVLVVDTGSSIKVRDLADMVQKEEYKLSRYFPDEINQTANSAYQSISQLKYGRTQTYLGLMTSALNKMKVTLNLNFN